MIIKVFPKLFFKAPEHWSCAFYLWLEPEFKLKIRSRSSVKNLGPEPELWPFKR